MKRTTNYRYIPLLPLLVALLFLVTIHASSLAQDASADPTIHKDSIIAIAETVFPADRTPARWQPRFQFEVSKPLTGEDRFSVEISYPGRKDRTKAECDGIYSGETVSFNCENSNTAVRDLPNLVGLVDFEIRMANELYGKNLVLFRGKMKVVQGPERKGDSVTKFHVDDDWRIPIGYLSRCGGSLCFSVWWFGETNPSGISFHLFHEGKAIAKGDLCGNQPVSCWFKTDKGAGVAALGPGAYEIKVLKEGRLRRTATFTVAEDGSYDNGIASAFNLGSDKVIIPVSVVGDLPRPWNKLAWKTEAFFGNPLTGFTAPP